MALINCEECGKEVSDKAKICINCGCPIEVKIIDNEPFPDYLNDLDFSIGKKISEWSMLSEFNGYFYKTNANASLCVFEKGICIITGVDTIYTNINFNQIIDVNIYDDTDVTEKSKSPIARAVAGGLLLGPLGAVVGGISGIGNKEVKTKSILFEINYWDINTRKKDKISIISKKDIKVAMLVYETLSKQMQKYFK
ncbi:MAG: zinc ribbon domain-containing protein, partial [Sphingobacteriaceae bacterium]|nr:zinc ribbon domain-containing protein [Sphingobacteriaceae bacterium]